MASINMQFHCLPTELSEFLGRTISGENIYMVMLGGLPFSATMVDYGDLEKALTRAGQSELPMSIYLLPGSPELNVTSRADFYDRNPENIVIDVGPIRGSGLKQSAISTKTNDRRLLEVAKRIAKEVRAHTHAGVTAVNVETGAMNLIKTFRYSDGAQNLERNGVDMLPFAGGAKLVLGDIVG